METTTIVIQTKAPMKLVFISCSVMIVGAMMLGNTDRYMTNIQSMGLAFSVISSVLFGHWTGTILNVHSEKK